MSMDSNKELPRQKKNEFEDKENKRAGSFKDAFWGLLAKYPSVSRRFAFIETERNVRNKDVNLKSDMTNAPAITGRSASGGKDIIEGDRFVENRVGEPVWIIDNIRHVQGLDHPLVQMTRENAPGISKSLSVTVLQELDSFKRVEQKPN